MKPTGPIDHQLGKRPRKYRSKELARLYKLACRAEISALKIGNTHLWGRGKAKPEDFTAVAEATAAPLCRAEGRVGERILAAARAAVKTRGENLNLGIILLAAPILKTARRYGSCLPSQLEKTLEATSLADSLNVFRAIRLLKPAALRRKVASQSVFSAPTLTLRRVMALAANYDLIAAQYAAGFPQVFAGSRFIAENRRLDRPLSEAVALIHLRFLSMGDSHLAKAVSAKAAASARTLALKLLEDCKRRGFSLRRLLQADRKLKKANANPGTSADLATASALVAFINERW